MAFYARLFRQVTGSMEHFDTGPTRLQLYNGQATWTIPTGPENEQTVLPGDGENPEFHEASEQGVQGDPVEVVANRLADLAPGHADVPGVGNKRHDPIGDRDMLTAHSITTLNPRGIINYVHVQYICTTHILCGATTDTTDFWNSSVLSLLMWY